MRSTGWRVARDSAERTRRALRERDVLRDDLGVLRDTEWVTFPLRRLPEQPPADGEAVEAEFAAAKRRPPTSYQELLLWPEPDSRLLPRSYDVVGDIVLVRIPTAIRSRSEEVGEALRAFVPGARLVARDEGVHGTERRRRLVRIAGAGPFRTVHRENGLDLVVDVQAAYFSPRLGREHARVAAAVRPGERVFDLCCGVGPFALAIAKAGKAREVVAVDSNPAAVALLRENVQRLGVGDRVRSVEADVEAFLRRAGVAGRVVFNLPHEGIKYLPSVAKSVEPGGILHYYEVTDRSAGEGRPDALEAMLAEHGAYAVAERHVVHPYSPQADLVAYRIARSPG